MNLYRTLLLSGVPVIIVEVLILQLTAFVAASHLCFKCDSISNITDCQDLHLCASGEFCYARRESLGNDTTYTLGCTKYENCPDRTTVPTTIPPPTTAATTPNATTDNTTLVAVSPTRTLILIPTHPPVSPVQSYSTTYFGPIPTKPTKASSVPDPGMVGRSIDDLDLDDAYPEETRCCYNEQCNLQLFETVNNTECHDKLGFPCDYTNNTFGICSDIHHAKTVCRKYCGLCDLVDGNWSAWSKFSVCDVSCGNGTKIRHRNCSNPAPEHGGLDCQGNDTEYSNCYLRDCPVHGGWNKWSGWSACSDTCGVGLKTRYRNCSNPFPDPDGFYCFGKAVDENVCLEDYCEDGVWENWSTWTGCSRTCGTGIKHRHRTCNMTSPFVRPCQGDSSESALCHEEKPCDLGKWQAWSSWSECSESCKPGIRQRHRNCTLQSLYSSPCSGDGLEVQTCNPDLCAETESSAFSVSGRPQHVMDSNDTITFVNVITNVGNDFNITSGQFTTRVAGLYEFFVTIEKQVNNGEAHCQIFMNERKLLTIAARSVLIDTDSFQQASNMLVLHLKPGDVVYLGMCTAPETMSNACSFSGILVQKG